MSVFASLVSALSDALDPVFGTAATAAAIVAFTLCVRLALHPLARAAVRGERARSALAPRVAELRRKHGKNPERLRAELSALQAAEGASPVAGCLPTLLQLPVFFLMYHLFTTDDALLEHTLFGAPLGGRLTAALGDGGFGGLLGAPALVHLALLVVTAGVAVWNYRRARLAQAPVPPQASVKGSGGGGKSQSSDGAAQADVARAMARFMPLLSFGIVFTTAVVPLAAGLYVVTSTAWTAVERAALGAGRPAPVRLAGASGSAAGGAAGGRS